MSTLVIAIGFVGLVGVAVALIAVGYAARMLADHGVEVSRLRTARDDHERRIAELEALLKLRPETRAARMVREKSDDILVDVMDLIEDASVVVARAKVVQAAINELPESIKVKTRPE